MLYLENSFGSIEMLLICGGRESQIQLFFLQNPSSLYVAKATLLYLTDDSTGLV